MRPLVIGTYPPRVCGIATFTADVVASLEGRAGFERPGVAAVVTDAQELGPDVVAVIGHDDVASYREAAVVANGFDAVLLEHEFGIFGGPDGALILDLIEALEVPLVVALHTVLPHPSPHQARIVRQLCDRAASVMVFTATARRMVLEQHLVRASKLRVVAHGAPAELYTPRSSSAAKASLGVDDRPVVSTFGLLSSGKGIEVAVEAMARVRDLVPDVAYVIAGRTHPEIVRTEGEKYREGLKRRVRELDLEDNVIFLDRFLDLEDLAQLLAATDVFCTPYLHGDQIVSGALTFAIAAGKPAVSTPYRYAEDLLSDGAGRLVPFGEAEPLADALTELLVKPEALEEAREAARRAGASLSWPEVGRQTAAVLRDAIDMHRKRRAASRRVPRLHGPRRPDSVVRTSTAHLRAMVDETGIYQHAEGRVPALEHGYCVDDVARLLPVAQELALTDATWAPDVVRALAFLRAASDGESAAMRNFLSWDRKWLDEPHDGDHVGRTIWALGELLSSETDPALHAPADTLIRRLISGLDASNPTIRTSAYAILGLAAWGPTRPASATALLQRHVQSLASLWRPDRAWPWFEAQLTYDNARLCEALIRGGAQVADDRAVGIGLASLEWLDALCSDSSGVYRFPGNVWVAEGDRVADSGDEQPLEALGLMETHVAALDVTGDGAHAEAASRCLAWFLGANVLATVLADCSTGACRDGLGLVPNFNCGAESTLAFQRAVLVHRKLAARPVRAVASVIA